MSIVIFRTAERAAEWLFPARWIFWIAIIPSVINGLLLRWVDVDLRTPVRLQYVSWSVIVLWLALANSSLIYWFAPGDSSDPRPRYRRMYRFAVVYPVLSTLVYYVIGCGYLWFYVATLRALNY